ncbi:MAG: metalloregulator ArsR/SmtB family transcription factor [Thermomicrobiales bacterium]
MDVFDAIADPNRREILMLLRHQRMSAGAIARHFSISRPAVSRHLRILREAGLVEARTIGRAREYALAVGRLDVVRDWLQAFEPRVPESVLDAFETEVYRTRRERRAELRDAALLEEESA